MSTKRENIQIKLERSCLFVFMGILLKIRLHLYKTANSTPPRASRLAYQNLLGRNKEKPKKRCDGVIYAVRQENPERDSLLGAGQIHQSRLSSHLSYLSLTVSTLWEGCVRCPRHVTHTRAYRSAPGRGALSLNCLLSLRTCL